MKIKIKYSLQRDINNYIDSLYRFRWNKHGRKNIQNNLLNPFPDDFKKALKEAVNKEAAEKVVEKFLRQGIARRKKTYLTVTNKLERAWKESEFSIINNLEKAYY